MILSDEHLINTLRNSQFTYCEIQKRVVDSRATEREIDIARNDYRDIATRGKLLFFSILDL